MPSSQPARLGDWLLDQGHVTQTQLDLALREQKRKGGLLGEVLVELGLVEQSTLAEFLASKTKTGQAALSQLQIPPTLLRLVPATLARQFTAIPIGEKEGVLQIAIADPLNVQAFDALELVTERRIELIAATESEILSALERHYQDGQDLDTIVDELLKTGIARSGNVAESDAPMIRLAERILSEAVTNGVSDVHVQPEDKYLRIRWRKDGMLGAGYLMPKELQSPLIARFKILGKMDIAESRRPQGGRCSVSIAGREVGLRISSLPTSFGESVVLRLLDRSQTNLGIDTLGMPASLVSGFRSLLDRPYGIILVTGPTGSGKTTTLYAALSEINAEEKSIFTLEDPIEYQLPLVRQTQVHESIGLTFAEGLRTLLRQDPDVILIGETRDTETAELMVRAALTGHLVFSSLHTNDAPGAVPRLADLGAKPYLLAPTLAGVIGQRLVRKLCTHCRVPVSDPKNQLQRLNLPLPADLPPTLWNAKGCAECNNVGYRGRLGIYELLLADADVQEAIVQGVDAETMRRTAIRSGFQTMAVDGLHKALRGLTTIAEVLRVTQA